MRKLDKYKQNLSIQGNQVWSYTTHVATIDGNDLLQLGYWSQTTQKHINYVANQLDLVLVYDAEVRERAEHKLYS